MCSLHEVDDKECSVGGCMYPHVEQNTDLIHIYNLHMKHFGEY